MIQKKRIVVLGGGFGGLGDARHLDRTFRDDEDVDITLISDTNFLVYSPLLAEVAGGTIEPRYAVPPLRTFLRKKVRVQEATVERIDVAAQKITVTYSKGDWDEWQGELDYDYLVIALGATTNTRHAMGVTTYAVGLKDLPDAMFLRNRVLTMLERAEDTTDPKLRQELLTFVVAGGGFSGVESIGALDDLAHGALRFYPGIRPSELHFILAPHGHRLLTEVDQRLGEYVVQKFQNRDIDVRMGVGVTAVTAHTATLTTGEVIPTRTVVWTTGVEVNPVLQRVDLPKDRHGAIVVNNRLQVEGHPHIFAVGDCAAVPMPDGGGTYSLTAQNATREGPVAAKNVAAMVRNVGTLKPFNYKPMGSLASLGCRQAVAQIEQVHLSGLLAWIAWRGVYLFKLPTLTDRMLVLLDWMTDLVAPVDIVQVPLGRKRFVGAMMADESRTATPATTAKEQQPASGQSVPSH